MIKKISNYKCHNFSIIILIYTLLMCPAILAQSWQSLGPGPLYRGQNEGLTNRAVIGAIHGIAPHPSDSNIIYVATVNGGIWKTNNAKDVSPTWIPQTDIQSSMSMGDVEFDLTDNTYQTLIAGSGRFSSLGRIGGDRAGVFRTTDGGVTWVDLNGGMEGKNIASVEARGSILLAAVDRADSFTCENIGIYRSTDTGASWSQLTATQGIPRGGASSLVADPLNSNTFYAGVNTYGSCSSLARGIYKTTDAGASWIKVSDSAMEAVIGTRSCHFEIAVGRNVGTNPGETGNVFASMVCSSGRLSALFRSGDAGITWTAMDIPETFDNEGNNGAGGVVGLHPGGQGNTHSSIAADPTNDNIVYLGGDRQPYGFPNSIGANDYSGRLFRGDASQVPGSQMTPLTHIGTANNSAPHADSRDLQFDSDGNLLESDDGGIFKRLLPRSTTGDWFSINGDLKITEQHDAYYDTNSAVVVSGNQDNGTSIQSLFASTTWNNFFNADGGDVVVDDISLAGSNQSVRFYSFQNLGAFRRVVYDQNNNIVSVTGPALTVIDGGADFNAQFVTPLAINNINGNRMIIGGGNSVYESMDHATTLSEIGAGIYVVGTGRNNIAYGATDNEDILYVGACQADCTLANDGDDGVFVRTTVGGAFTHVYTPTSSVIQGVTINPNDSTEAFVIENSVVLHTSDTGAMWSDITGDLSNFGRLRSIEFLPDDNNSKLVVGSNRGVFISEQADGYTQWTTPADGMPNVPVFELHYDSISDRLIAGTMGRGSFVLDSLLSDNLPPVIGSESISLVKGDTVIAVDGGASSLIANDTDPDVGDILSMETTAVKEPMNGLLVLNTNGTFSYQHDDSYTDSDQFFYRVCDNGNPVKCSDGQVDIAIDLGGAICSTPNLDIPDNNFSGVTNTLSMVNTGRLMDLDVSLEINHEWVSDVTVSLTHLSSGTEVLLMDRPGIPATATGCEETDISVTLDDDAISSVEDECDINGSIAISGILSPNEMLAGFNNLELSGNWRIKVSDAKGNETGKLISWCLNPTFYPDLIFVNGFESP